MTAGLAALAAAGPAQAATYNVTGFGDGAGDCGGTGPFNCTTLRAAITAANRVGGPNTIVMPQGNYVLTQAELPVASEMTIVGRSTSTTTVSAEDKFRVLNVTTTRPVTITQLTVTKGAAPSASGGNMLIGQGANVTLDHVRVTAGNANRGGGIAMQGGSNVTIRQSLIDANHANSAVTGGGGDAGGLLSVGNTKVGGNVLKISDSTIAFNQASTAAGLEVMDNPANATSIDRATIAFNSGGSN